MDRVCYTCLEAKQTFMDKDTQQQICNDCFAKKYKRGGRRRYPEPKENPTMGDLMNKWNRK